MGCRSTDLHSFKFAHNYTPLLQNLLPAHPKVAARRSSVGSYSQARETNKKNTGSLTQNTHLRLCTYANPASQIGAAIIPTLRRYSNKLFLPSKPLLSFRNTYIVKRAAIAQPTWKPRLFSISVCECRLLFLTSTFYRNVNWKLNRNSPYGIFKVTNNYQLSVLQ